MAAQRTRRDSIPGPLGSTLYRRGKTWYVRTADGERLKVGRVSKLGERPGLRLAKAARRVIEGSGPGTLHAFLDEYEAAHRAVAPASHDATYGKLRRLAGLLGGVRMKDVGLAEARDLVARLAAAGLKGRPLRASTVAALVKKLAHVWKAAGLDQANPWRAVALPRVQERPVPSLTADDRARLLAACSPSLRPFVALLLETGLRKGEALRLRWGDVVEDGAGAWLTVRASKSGKPRTVKLTAAARSVLGALRPGDSAETSSSLVFPDEPRLKDLHRACTEAGVERLRFHDCRHIFAVRCARAGVSMLKLAKILGHSSVRLTERYASHGPGELAAQGIDELERGESS